MVVGEIEESAEVVVVGAGTGGYVAAIRLAQLGKETVLVSKDDSPGGVCLLRGCIPSKALIEVVKLYEKIQSAETMGLHVKDVRIDVTELQNWKNQVVAKLSGGVKQLLKQNGVEFVHGEAYFKNNHSMEIRTNGQKRYLNFKNAIIATGSRPKELKGFPFDEQNILSSTGALNLTEAPKSLLVIGGGYIGLELGTVYARLGAKVTIAEATDSLLPGTDKDLVRPVQKKLEGSGVEIHLETLALSPKKKGNGFEVTLQKKDGEKNQGEFEKILVAVGREPNIDGFGLENTGVKVNEEGFIPINERCQTQLPHLFAIGDVAGGMMLAHKASREGKVAAANIAGQSDAFDNQVPAVIFTDPEIAYVGMQESEAKAKGLETVVGRFSFAALGRALTMNEKEGFIKVIAEKSSQRILGVQMVGPHVSDLISEATLGLEMGTLLEDFALTIHPHPTLPEALEEAMESALGMPIHRFQQRK